VEASRGHDEAYGGGGLSTALVVGVILAVALAALTYLVGYQNGKGSNAPERVLVGSTGLPVPDAPSPAPAFSSDELAADPTDGWLTNGGSLSNERFSPLDQVNTENVGDLRGEWMVHLDGSGTAAKYSGEATPVVYDGVIYTITGANDVFANAVSNGQQLWKYEANLDQKINTVCCGWTSRGVAIGDGLVYIGQLDGQLVALNQETGEVEWKTKVGEWKRGETITNAPLYYDGRVYTGLSGGEFGIRGRLVAYDAATGEKEWTFWTIPGPGEEGHDTWPQDNNAWKHGGAPVWQTPAVDPELGLMYFSTGNASPDLNGKGRAGDNLFATSIVAIDAETGEYRWHFQQVHHDIWDYDAPSPVVLWDAEINGETVHGLSEPGKTGWLYMLDRETGEPIHGITERPVPQMDGVQATADTQPFPDTPPFARQQPTDAEVKEITELAQDALGEDTEVQAAQGMFEPFAETTKVISPGPPGGTNWPPSSFSPDSDMVYICGIDSASGYQSTALQELEEGQQYLSSVLTLSGFGSQDGVLAAQDVTTGEIAWKHEWRDEACYSGTTATAGGLVFAGRSTGELQAYDAETGDELWSFQTGAGANATPAIFEEDGTQYVAFYAAGNSLAASAHGDSLWLFSLEGEMEEVRPNSSLRGGGDPGAGGTHAGAEPQVEQEESVAPDSGGEADVREGPLAEQLFADNCSACHGFDGGGGNGGPSLQDIDADVGEITDQIANGGNGMPPFGDQLTDQEIEALAAYILGDIAGSK
jgi:alcohol dehydrogenase (cytochrome c)